MNKKVNWGKPLHTENGIPAKLIHKFGTCTDRSERWLVEIEQRSQSQILIHRLVMCDEYGGTVPICTPEEDWKKYDHPTIVNMPHKRTVWMYFFMYCGKLEPVIDYTGKGIDENQHNGILFSKKKLTVKEGEGIS